MKYEKPPVSFSEMGRIVGWKQEGPISYLIHVCCFTLCVLQQIPGTPWALPVFKLLQEISFSVKKKESLKIVVFK